MCCGKTFADCAKNCLCCVNFSNAVMGVVLVFICVWIKGDETMQKIILFVPTIGTFFGLMIALGVIIVIVSMLGCIGAMMRHKYILMAYFVILAIMALIKFIVAMVYLVKAAKDVSPEVIEMLQKRFDNNRMTYMAIEGMLTCCGVTGADTYFKAGTYPSPSCCPIGRDSLPGRCSAKKAYPSCESKVWPYLRAAYRIFAGLLLAVVFLEGVLLFLTFQVIWAIHKNTLTTVTSQRPDNLPSNPASGVGTPSVNTAQLQSAGTAAVNTGQLQPPVTTAVNNTPPRQ